MYYDDPLAAAYMAREFGVEYYTYPDGSDKDDPINCDEFKDHGVCLSDNSTFYIHPDSLHIFNPRRGDLVYYHPIDLHELWCWSEWEPSDIHKSFSDIGDIIQRNDKPFFMPLESLDVVAV